MKNLFLILPVFFFLIVSSVFAQTERDSLVYLADAYVGKYHDSIYQEVKKHILEQKVDLSALYPYNKADKVEIVACYNAPTNYDNLLKGGKVNLKPDEINGRKFLNREQVYRLAQLFNNLDPGLCSDAAMGDPDPMAPRHLIVFYDKKGKAFTCIEVSFEYMAAKVTDSKIRKHTICDKNIGLFCHLLFQLDLDPDPKVPPIYEDPIYSGVDYENYQSLYNSGNGKKGLKKDGNIIVPVEYDDVLSLGYEGLFQVQLGEKTGFIDAKNRIVIPFEFDADTLKIAGRVFEIAEGDYGRQFLISSSIARCGFWDGLCAVVKNGKYGYIDKTGKTVIPFIYDGANSFSNGYAIVIKDNKYGVIDTKGNLVADFIYDRLYRDIRGGDIFYFGDDDLISLDLH